MAAMSGLVLSLFPGIGMLDRAFEEEGFTVVRGPDALWGGDVHRFHPPANVFAGVIGGPPCQAHSRLRHIVKANGYKLAPDLIPEFVRCVREASPQWFLMENVPDAPVPEIPPFSIHSQLFNNRWTGETQNRVRRITFGTLAGAMLHIPQEALDSPKWEPTVTSSAGGRRLPVKIGGSGEMKGRQRKGQGGELRKWSLADMIRLQGLPEDFLSDSPLTAEGKKTVIGNGVPLAIGKAIARAVRVALWTGGS